MNVIFLDIDGVLNTERYIMEQDEKNDCKRPKLYDYNFDPITLDNLKELVEKSNANIVISSTWRISKNEFEMWKQNKYSNNKSWNAMIKNLESISIKDKVIGVTPWMNKHRGDEIRKWLQDNKNLNIENFVILNDDSDMCEFTKTHLAKCSWENGFVESIKIKALQILECE